MFSIYVMSVAYLFAHLYYETTYKRGLGDVRETSRSVSFCAHAILSKEEVFVGKYNIFNSVIHYDNNHTILQNIPP